MKWLGIKSKLVWTNLLNYSPGRTKLGQDGFHCHADCTHQSWREEQESAVSQVNKQKEAAGWNVTPCTEEQMRANTFFFLLTQSGQAKTSDRTLHILTHPGCVPLLYRAGERDAANSLQREQMSNYWQHESWNIAKVVALLAIINKLNKIIRRWKQMVLLTTVRENTLWAFHVWICVCFTTTQVLPCQLTQTSTTHPILLETASKFQKQNLKTLIQQLLCSQAYFKIVTQIELILFYFFKPYQSLSVHLNKL